MNTVALPASAASTVLDAEADLLRQAARGNAEAFGEMFRRHSQPAWRLAQAIAPDRDSAVESFGEGFTRALRAQRRSRRDLNGRRAFRPQVLAAVYRAAVSHALERSAPPERARNADSPEAALADAAFRSLPERWRAAVWLSEVENLDAERIATILGVSVPVANQLVARGQRGLLGRFAQTRTQAPDHIGPVLRSAALSQPANLADVTRARLDDAHFERAPILVPVGGWLEDRAARPMSVAVGALFGLGLIALGVVPQASPIRGTLGASGGGSLSGAVPVHTCAGLPCSYTTSYTGGTMASVGTFPDFPSSGGSGDTASPGAGSFGSPADGFSVGSFGAGSNAGGTSGSGPIGLPSNPPTDPVGSLLPSLPGTPAVPPAPTGGTPLNPPPAPGPQPATVPLSPVGTATVGGSGTQVNLLPTGTTSAVSATVSPTCGAGATVAGTTTSTCTTSGSSTTSTVPGL